MDTDQNIKVARSWLNYVEPLVRSSSSAVILGLGNGLHVRMFQTRFPQNKIYLVDPRRDLIEKYAESELEGLQYARSTTGVILLRKQIESLNTPTPILEFRPCWHPHQPFFEWTTTYLKASRECNYWDNTPAEFILESLFR